MFTNNAPDKNYKKYKKYKIIKNYKNYKVSIPLRLKEVKIKSKKYNFLSPKWIKMEWKCNLTFLRENLIIYLEFFLIKKKLYESS